MLQARAQAEAHRHRAPNDLFINIDEHYMFNVTQLRSFLRCVRPDIEWIREHSGVPLPPTENELWEHGLLYIWDKVVYWNFPEDVQPYPWWVI